MKIYPVLKKNKNKKKSKWIYKLRNYPLTRAGITANPLEMYNPVSLNIVGNNTLVTHNGLDFVGGDTDTYEYDFFTKVAGSNLECPVKIYRQYKPTLLPATDGQWAEFGVGEQTNIDKLKVQDGTFLSMSDLTNGNICQMMVEVDLTPLANAVGGNSALKSALKSINVDVWANGSGSNAGVNTSGVKTVFRIADSNWQDDTNVGLKGEWWHENTTPSISKITTLASTQPASANKVSSNNKIYILIHSTYASDGTIPSTVSIDYLKVTIQLNRVPDTVQAIPVNLPKYFACVIKGFSPNYNSTDTKPWKRILRFYKDSTNYFDLVRRLDTIPFRIDNQVNGVTNSSLSANAQTFNKNQVYNILIESTSTGKTLRLLKNNGIVEKYTNTDTTYFSGLCNLYLLADGTTSQADSFLDNVTLIDLEKIGKSAGYTDAEATAILNGTASGFENPELFDINKVTLHPNATLSNGVITLNASASGQNNYLDIPVLPNNKYELKIISTGGTCSLSEYYNNIKLKETYGVIGTQTLSVVTIANTNKIRVNLFSASAGTFTYSNISLKRKD